MKIGAITGSLRTVPGGILAPMTIDRSPQETPLERARRLADEALRGEAAAPSQDPAREALTRSRVAARDVARELPADSPARVTRTFSYILDDMIRVPGTNVRFGVDPLLSLIPIPALGSAVGAAFGTVVLVDAVRLRAPISVVARMLGNYVIDWLVGLVPVLGAFFDMAYRSNRKNLRLLNRAIANREQVRKASIFYWIGIIAMVAFTVAVVIGVPIALLLWLDALISRQ